MIVQETDMGSQPDGDIIGQDSTEPLFADVITSRRSLRAFSNKNIGKNAIEALFEAARWAPSAMNEQPWLYVYANSENTTLYSAITNCLNPSNQVWAAKAPLLIVSIARENFARNGAHNPAALHDVGMANLALSLKATSLGLTAHMMGGFNAASLKEVLQLPENTKPVVVIAVGYPGNINELPRDLQLREIAPRTRLDASKFVFNNSFHS